MLLGGQAEGVPAHRVQDAPAAHALIAADDVGGRLPLGMADVQAVAAGIGEHVEHIQLFADAAAAAWRKCGARLPILLPLGLDLGRVVAGHGSTEFLRFGDWLYVRATLPDYRTDTPAEFLAHGPARSRLCVRLASIGAGIAGGKVYQEFAGFYWLRAGTANGRKQEEGLGARGGD